AFRGSLDGEATFGPLSNLVAGATQDPGVIVDVTPSAFTVDVGSQRQLDAQVTDSYGNPINQAVTWTSSRSTVATVSSGGTVSGVSNGDATIRATASGGTSNTSDATVTSPTTDGGGGGGSGSGVTPGTNEPSAFVTINRQPWDVVPYSGSGAAPASSNYWKTNTPGDYRIVTDQNAPISAPEVLEALQLAGEGNGNTISKCWIHFPNYGQDIYTKLFFSVWMKLESGWVNNPVGAKLAFFRLPTWGRYNGHNSVYIGLDNNGNSGSTPDADQLNVQVNLQGTPGGNRNLYANVNSSAANIGTGAGNDRRGKWVLVEVLLELNTTGNATTGAGANGVVKVWVDGVPTADYRDIAFRDPADAWTWQSVDWVLVYGGGPGAPSTDQRIFADEIYLSGSN
ncbi:MAG: Ig-like domain-containing protein, partial [Planctomycetota bacterium]